MTLTDLLPARYRTAENPLKAERRIELAAVLLLLLVLSWLLMGLVSQALNSGPEPIMPAQDSLTVQGLELRPPLDADDTAVMLQRPLFWEGRRPLAPVAAAVAVRPASSTQSLEGVVLNGVYGTGESMGIIATVDADVRRIGKGESVKGWQFTQYESGVATFTSGERQATLTLDLATPTVSTAPVRTQRNATETNVAASEQGDAEPAGTDASPQEQAEAMQRDQLQQQLDQMKQRSGLTFGSGGGGQQKKGLR